MKIPKIILSTSLITLLCSCSSMKKSLSVGVVSGASMGAVSGASMSSRDKGKGALKGAAVGALIGGIASYFIHGELVKRDKQVRKETLFNLDQYGVMSGPSSSKANVNGITFPVDSEEFIPTHRKGNKVIEQHRIWNISDNAQWSETKEKKNDKQ